MLFASASLFAAFLAALFSSFVGIFPPSSLRNLLEREGRTDRTDRVPHSRHLVRGCSLENGKRDDCE